MSWNDKVLFTGKEKVIDDKYSIREASQKKNNEDSENGPISLNLPSFKPYREQKDSKSWYFFQPPYLLLL